MKKLGLLLAGFIVGGTVHSQNVPSDSLRKGRIEYYFQFRSGALIGCSPCSSGKQINFSGSTVHGIKIGRKLRVGAGAGLDSYFEWNTLPVFGNVSWDLFGKRNAVFVEFAYGGALALWRPYYREEYGFQKSNAGKMYSYGVGYRIKYDKMRISVGLGHKTQHAVSYYEYRNYYWHNNKQILGEPSRKIVKNEMNRLVVWMAIGWK